MRNSFVTTTRKLPIETDSSEICFIILSGGIPCGTKTLGVKNMYKIAPNRTFMDCQIETIRSVFPKSDIIITTGFESNRIINNKPDSVRIIENQLYKTSNEVEEIRLALNNTISKNVVIIPNNILFDKLTIKNINYSVSCCWVNNFNNDGDDVGCNIIDTKIQLFEFGLTDKFTGIVHLTNKELKKAKVLSRKEENRNMFTFELLNQILDNKGCIYKIDDSGNFIKKINKPDDIQI